MVNSLLYDLVNQMYIYSDSQEAPQDAIFESEADIIRKLAAKGSCVILGRCADYILRDHPNCLKVYLHASAGYRTGRVMETEQLSRNEAIQKIRRMDRRRSDNYHYYTRQIWGHAGNYDLTVNTEIGMEAVQNLICQMLSMKFQNF